MRSLLYSLSLLILNNINIATSQTCKPKPYNVVCYLASWSVYREGRGMFNVSYIIPTYCTHLVYTFAGLGLNGGLDSLDHYNDINFNKGYERIVGLKEENPCLKVMLAIGGWNEGSEKYSLMAETEESRVEFADHALKYLAHFGFDGLDLDWEYPTLRGGIPEDKTNFILLLKTLRNKFQHRKKLLSVAIGGSPGIIQAAYDLTAMCEVLDFINLMAYDYGLKNIASVDAPLYSESTTRSESADGAIKLIRQSGCPMKKINLGIPTRAKTYTLRAGVKGDLRTGIAIQGAGRAGPYTKNAGTLGYNELCEMIKEGKWATKMMQSVMVKVGFLGDQWVTYDDADTTTAKTKYVKEKGLGGVMFWTIDTDDYHGDCHNEAYPMVRAANRVFGYISPAYVTLWSLPHGHRSRSLPQSGTAAVLHLEFRENARAERDDPGHLQALPVPEQRLPAVRRAPLSGSGRERLLVATLPGLPTAGLRVERPRRQGLGRFGCRRSEFQGPLEPAGWEGEPDKLHRGVRGSRWISDESVWTDRSAGSWFVGSLGTEPCGRSGCDQVEAGRGRTTGGERKHWEEDSADVRHRTARLRRVGHSGWDGRSGGDGQHHPEARVPRGSDGQRGRGRNGTGGAVLHRWWAGDLQGLRGRPAQHGQRVDGDGGGQLPRRHRSRRGPVRSARRRRRRQGQMDGRGRWRQAVRQPCQHCPAGGRLARCPLVEVAGKGRFRMELNGVCVEVY